MKNKSTVLLGIVFLLLVVIYLATSLNPREKSKGATPLFEGQKPDIDKIEFNSVKRGHIVLEKKNGEWFITEPFEYKAYDQSVETTIEDLFKTVVDGVISSREESQSRYLVSDSTGTNMKIYSAGNPILDVIVGKQTSELGHYYTRKAGSHDIELWRGMVSQEVVKDADGWRDKTLYNFNMDDLLSIEAVEENQTRTLTRADTLWVYTENGVEKPVDPNRVNYLAMIIAELRCDAFASGDDIPRAGEKAPDVRVTFLVRNGDRHSFEVWKPDDNSKNYLVRKVGEEGDILYRFYQYRGDQVIIDYEKLKPVSAS